MSMVPGGSVSEAPGLSLRVEWRRAKWLPCWPRTWKDVRGGTGHVPTDKYIRSRVNYGLCLHE